MRLDYTCEGGTSVLFYLFLFLFYFNLTYSRWTSSLPSCLWSQRIFPSHPGSRLPTFLSRCKFSTLTTRQPMVEFYLLRSHAFRYERKSTSPTLIRIELTTSALAGVQVTYQTTHWSQLYLHYCPRNQFDIPLRLRIESSPRFNVC